MEVAEIGVAKMFECHCTIFSSTVFTRTIILDILPFVELFLLE